jgi:hypothetical protein
MVFVTFPNRRLCIDAAPLPVAGTPATEIVKLVIDGLPPSPVLLDGSVELDAKVRGNLVVHRCLVLFRATARYQCASDSLKRGR